jgi:hypothetical protein
MTGTAATTRGRWRRRSRIIGLAGSAAASLLLAPSAADAQAMAACDPADPAQRPALVIRGLPARIAPDRDIPFLIARAARGTTPAVYRGGASVATERPREEELLTEYFFDGRDDRLLARGTRYWVRMRGGEAPATVTLAYPQDTPAGRCRVRLTRRVLSVAPRAPRVRLERRHRAGVAARLGVGVAGGCWRGRAGATTVRVSGGGRTRTIRLADLCERWSRRTTRLPGLAVTAVDAGAERGLTFRTTGPGGRYRVSVSFRGRVVLRGTVRAAA